MAHEKILGRQNEQSVPKVKTYDFKRPDKFSKEQIRTISIMHETFARLTTTSLSAQLRAKVQLHVSSVDQCTYEEYLQSVPTPTTFGLINMSPLRGRALLEISPKITFAMIDRLFGGQGKYSGFTRSITNLEQLLMEGIYTRVLKNLREAWSTVLDIQPNVFAIETNPSLTQIVPPKEMVVLVTFEIGLNGENGLMTLCLPYLTIEPVIPRLSAQYWFSKIKKGNGVMPGVKTAHLKINSELFVKAEKCSLSKIAKLKKNLLILLPEFHKGKAYLNSGESTVLNLIRAEKNDSFTIKDSQTSEDIIELLETDDINNNNKLKAEEQLLEKAFSKFSEVIKTTTDTLKNNISEISKKQDELADQIFYQAPERSIHDESPVLSTRPFGFIRFPDVENLFHVIGSEHPQTIALVLSYLDPKLSSIILGKLSSALQVDVSRRIAFMDRTAPQVIEAVEKWVSTKLKMIGDFEDKKSGGVESIVEILNLTTREVEKTVIVALEKEDAELAEMIKQKMFVFEDIILLDPKVIKLIMEKTDRTNLLLSLKGVDDTIKNHIFKSLNSDIVKKINNELTEIGPARLKDIEAAQQRIVEKIRQLEEQGSIIVARADEKLIE